MQEYGIHWFRRDLRVAGNPALKWNWKKNSGKVVSFFCFDSAFLAREDFSVNRFQFFLETLDALKTEMQEIGSDLIVLDVGPEEAFTKLFSKLSHLPKDISFNRDYEPFALARDKKITQIIRDKFKINLHTERDHLVIEPHELLKEDGSFYQVYTPYSRKWLASLQTQETQKRISFQTSGLEYLEKRSKGKSEKIFSLDWDQLFARGQMPEDKLNSYLESNKKKGTVTFLEVGSLAAYRQLKEFKDRLKNYDRDRNLPAIDGNSKFSIYLKNGSLTTSQIINFLNLKQSSTFLKELIWREFYYSILYHCPRVETESFHIKYKNIKWENNKKYFQAWKDGMTGFPIVDAGMRELKQTGFMHNRVRMIVASFLVKDLLIDWKWGEKYFMNQLLDGDLAANNGNWQWCASTGCDPQPYFRVFNPLLQSKKFDPDGEYIRKFIPELADLSAKQIHAPGDLAKSCGYPEPIVDHDQRRKQAILLFSQHRT